MTPIAGFILALVSGRSQSPSRAVKWMLAPWLVVLAIQTGWLAAGWGNNPATTVTHFPNVIGYVVVQALTLVLASWVAVRFADRRAVRRGDTADASATRFTRSTVVAAVTSAALSLVYLAATAPAHPGQGDGQPPVLGFVGIAACLATGATLAVLRRIETRASNQPAAPILADLL